MTINEDAAREAIRKLMVRNDSLTADWFTDEIIKALKALPEEGWTSVKEPPKHNGEYQVTWFFHNKWWQEVCSFYWGRWWGWNDIADEYNMERELVSHYRPLPAPPAEKEAKT